MSSLYTSVQIHNFRGFENLAVDGLTRVNLILGANNVGKTALLEAMGILANAPRTQFAYQLVRWRRTPVAGAKTSSMFENLFYNFDTGHKVEIIGQTEDSVEKVHLSIRDIKTTTVSLSKNDSEDLHIPEASDEEIRPVITPASSITPDELHIELHKKDANTLRTGTAQRPVLKSGRLVRMQFDEPKSNMDNEFLPVHTVYGLSNDAERLSQAILENKLEAIVRALQKIDPRINDLKILSLGTDAGIFAKLDDNDRLMPLGLLGSGTVRLLSMVLAASSVQNGMLIIDEIDTGLHYSKLCDMWRVMLATAMEFNYQLFATTHSYECMVAAYEAFKDKPEDLSVHRLERRDDGTIVSKDFGHEALGTALELGFEVR